MLTSVPCTPSLDALLPDLVARIDEGLLSEDRSEALQFWAGDDPERPGSGLKIGFRPVDTESDHPVEATIGLVAEPGWEVFGLVTPGKAHHLDEPGRPTRPIRNIHAVSRSGAEASLLRYLDD